MHSSKPESKAAAKSKHKTAVALEKAGIEQVSPSASMATLAVEREAPVAGGVGGDRFKHACGSLLLLFAGLLTLVFCMSLATAVAKVLVRRFLPFFQDEEEDEVKA